MGMYSHVQMQTSRITIDIIKFNVNTYTMTVYG